MVSTQGLPLQAVQPKGVQLQGIQKYFPANGVHALDNTDFDLHRAEIHALLGENGAGKSTLMHIMAGYMTPTAGRILVDMKDRHFTSPADALALGIGMVRQHPHLTPGFKVWEACILGAEPGFPWFLHPRKARNQVRSLSERWGFELPLERDTKDLTVSQRQKTAVLALLLRQTQYLIFDEPTAVLTPGETEGLFELFRLLKKEGKGLALISHKLEETMAIADRVTVLRKGKTQTSQAARSLRNETLQALMFGIDHQKKSGPVEDRACSADISHNRSLPSPCSGISSKPLLVVQGLSVEVPGRPFIRQIDLELFPGTILGIAGVRDSGLETLELAMSGFLAPSRGTIRLHDRELAGKGIHTFREAGGAYLSADRIGSALAPQLPLQDSIIIHAHRRSRRGLWGKWGIMEQGFLDAWAARIMDQAQVAGSFKTRADAFSGGMLQRILLARELAEKTSLLILAEPGWGLDRKNRERLTEELRRYVKPGRGVILFSTDVEELIAVSDTILVLRNGEFSARITLDPGKRGILPIEVYKRRIGQAMVGSTQEGSVHEAV
ncbi:MAG: ATP-binding cassette domain-containing protein [Treponema sp.]|jgi:simple sugar transport system ATP-binding protein|nr:ATP-binding cassette domain-containing protein [Treponema sp.]